MSLESIVENYRTFYGFDRLSNYCNLNTWKKDGIKGLEDDALTEMKRIIDNHDFELGGDRKKDIESIYKMGGKLLLNWDNLIKRKDVCVYEQQ